MDAEKDDLDEGMFGSTDETEDDVENPDESSEMARVAFEDAIKQPDEQIIGIPNGPDCSEDHREFTVAAY